MVGRAAWVAIGILSATLVVAFVATWWDGSRVPVRSAPERPRGADSNAPHSLPNAADEAVVLADGCDEVRSTAEPGLAETIRAVIRAVGEAGEPAALTIDYPHDESIFPPEIVAPTFLWH